MMKAGARGGGVRDSGDFRRGARDGLHDHGFCGGPAGADPFGGGGVSNPLASRSRDSGEAVRERLVRAMERRLLKARHALMERAQDGAFARMMDLIRQRQQKLDDLTYRLERGERQLLDSCGGSGRRLRRRCGTTICGGCWRGFAAA